MFVRCWRGYDGTVSENTPRYVGQVLEAMGQKPTEEELFQMISEVDDNMSGSIDFPEFLKVGPPVLFLVIHP